jgi:hypothetical protein
LDQQPTCPSCHAPIGKEDQQCLKCGIFIAKWKESKQRAAEAKLAAFAAEANKGFPVWLKLVIAMLLLGPVIVIFVPDVGVPILGGKLRYHFGKGTQIKHSGTALLTINLGDSRTPIDIIETKASTNLFATETDSGGNTTLKRTFEEISIEFVHDQKPAQVKDGSGWIKGWVMNPRGGSISTMAGAVSQMGTNAATMKMHNQLRSEQRERDEFRWNTQPETTPLPPVSDPTETIFSELSPSHLSHLDLSTIFEWPKDRVRPGFTWNQQMGMILQSKIFYMALSEPITFKVDRFERQSDGYMTVISWEKPVTIKFSNEPMIYKNMFTTVTMPAIYKGTAWVNYADGVISKLEGEIEGNLLLTSDQSVAIGSFAGTVGPSLQVKLTQKITRL